MLPIPSAGIGKLELPLLPPAPSGPNPSGPGAFTRVYDRLMSETDRASAHAGPQLPTAMEVRPLIAPAADLSQPFAASREFPGAVDAEGLLVPGRRAAAGDKTEQHPFEFLSPLKEGMEQVSKLSKASEALANEAAYGGDVDLHDVMIAAEKAGVATQLTLQVRNKLVEAYQDVMRMQV